MLYLPNFETLLIGYALHSLIWLLFGDRLKKKFGARANRFDMLACYAFAGAGLAFMLTYAVEAFIAYSEVSENEYERYSFINQAFGAYWFVFWGYMVFYTVGTQIYWFNHVHKLKVLRLLVSLILLISVEKIIIFITSFHRDYMPSSWAIYTAQTISFTVVKWIVSILLFYFIVAALFIFGKQTNTDEP